VSANNSDPRIVPQSPNVGMRASWITYGILVSFLVAMKLVIVATGLDVDGFAVVFSWPWLLGVSAAGVPGIFASRPAGFASMWDCEIRTRARFLAPALIGISFGLLTIYRDHLSSFAGIHLPLRVAIPAFSYGAIFIEILYRLFVLTTVVWFVSNVVLRHRGQVAVFWVVACLLALLEPLTQGNGFTSLTDAFGFVLLFGEDVCEAWLFRRFGFLAAVSMRMGLYWAWHILWIGLRTR
jgi:hypothetical protein